jgi:hypothetical protein
MANDPGKGGIKINSTPDGAAIRLAHKNSFIPVTPATPYTVENLEPGLYTVTVSIENDSSSNEVTVEADKTAAVQLTIDTPLVQNKKDWIARYTIAFIVVLAGIAILTHFNYIIPSDTLFRQLTFVACAGGLGGLAFNMYVYVHHIARENDFRLEYEQSYYLRPFIGILYGVFIFFLVAGGLMVLSGGITAPSSIGTGDIKSIMFFIALSFIAGYAEEPFSIQLKALAEALFKDPPAEDKTTTPK